MCAAGNKRQGFRKPQSDRSKVSPGCIANLQCPKGQTGPITFFIEIHKTKTLGHISEAIAAVLTPLGSLEQRFFSPWVVTPLRVE
jgi:hypothetical protein